MHEIGVMMEVIKAVESFAKANDVKKIEKLVLQIGELSPIIPKYMEDCYPAAVYQTFMEKTKLEIEILRGNGLCRNCGKIYNLIDNDFKCPDCGIEDFELLGGKEFLIKEIVAC